MKEDNRDIDRLLQANVERQLAEVDWDRFREDVQKRLAATALRRRSHVRYPGPLAAAAGLILTTGVLVAIVVRLRAPASDPSRPEVRVALSIQEPRRGVGSAAVVLDAKTRGIARCEVTLIDTRRSPPNPQTQPSWCVVARRGPSPRARVRNSDWTDIAPLF